MLNANGIRELAYVVIIDNVTPIEGYDRVELAHVGGWTIVVGKDEFRAGDPAIYFEIDSKLPEIEPFTNMEFLAKKHYKIKTQKMCKSISQGLLMSAANFGWHIAYCIGHKTPYIVDNNSKCHFIEDESRFLTAELGVTYAESGDNKRKAASADKYKVMAQRHRKLFSRQPFRTFMRYKWGRKLLFLLFGRTKDKKKGWPGWVKKTDEERVENMPWVLNNKDTWIATEKIDGTSTTFTMRKKNKKPYNFKYDFFVCSRNVVMDKPDKECYYDTNVYWEMAQKYKVEAVLKMLLEVSFPKAEWITLQGETFGIGVQKNNYGLEGHDFRAFNLITSDKGRLNSIEMERILKEVKIPSVPILNKEYILPDTIEELREYAMSTPSVISGEIKEGIVFRSLDATQSFKCVLPEYLMKYHQ